MIRFVLSAEARLDYLEALDFIEAHSQRAALKWEAMTLEAFTHLSDWPHTGRLRPEFAPPPIRFWVAGDYIVLYNSASKPIEIIAILHGAQNLAEIIPERLSESGPEK